MFEKIEPGTGVFKLPKIRSVRFIFVLFTIIFIMCYIVQKNYPKLNKVKYKNVEQIPDSLKVEKIFNGEKIVHFDLKGAPPKISYLLEFIPFIKTLGATGILLEYEDMFPYEDKEIRSHNSFTVSDVSKIVESAEKNNLTIIPLIQTFGHFEFVLKLEKYKQFREVKKNPEVLCPSNINVNKLLKKMIDQVIAAHPKLKYFHIGCDEVFYLGLCPKCEKRMKKNKWGQKDLYFNHIKEIAEYIIKNYPNVRPIIWGDKITKHTEDMVLTHNIPELVDVMLWNYKPHTDYPTLEDMLSYVKLFKSIWVASAFKGATGINQMVTNPYYHLHNNKVWMQIIYEWQNKINFNGIILTGWQRYNHFTMLCDLLPVGIPSLALSLQYINKDEGSYLENLRDLLKCNVEDVFNIEDLTKLNCSFPGFKVYQTVYTFHNKLYDYTYSFDNVKRGIFNFYNIIYNFLSPVYLQELYEQRQFEEHLLEINELEHEITKAMDEVYDEDTINEWIITYVTPYQMRLGAINIILNDSFHRSSWSRRPLQNNLTFVQEYFTKICSPYETKGCAFLTF